VTKTCTKCGVEKAIGSFAIKGRLADGSPRRRGKCRTCDWGRVYARKRVYRERYPEKVAASKRRGRKPELQKSQKARRRARLLGLPDDGSTVTDWLAHHEETDTWHCHLCGGAFAAGDEIHWDHRDPVSTGTAGTVLSNMAAAHAVCNLSRGTTPLHEWSTRVGLPEGVV